MGHCFGCSLWPGTALGMSLRKVSHKALRFFCIFEKSGKNKSTDLAVSKLWGSIIAIISAHVPGQHMWASAGQGRKNSASWMVLLRFTTLSARDHHWRNPRKTNYREHSNIKIESVSATCKHLVFVLASQTRASRAGEWSQELGSTQLILPSKTSITFWNSLRRDCKMTSRGSNLDSNLNCAAWPMSCKGFIAS